MDGRTDGQAEIKANPVSPHSSFSFYTSLLNESENYTFKITATSPWGQLGKSAMLLNRLC